MTVRRTDITQAFIEVQRDRGKQVDRLDAINDDLGGPYDAVVALHVLQHVEPDDLPPCWRRWPAPCVRAAGSSSPSPAAKAPAGRSASPAVPTTGRSGPRRSSSPPWRRPDSESEWTERSVDDEESGWLCVLAQVR